MKTFYLNRLLDVSGVSGVGRVAEGCQFHDGMCVLSWLGTIPSIEIHPSVESLLMIHGHQGATTIVWEP